MFIEKVLIVVALDKWFQNKTETKAIRTPVFQLFNEKFLRFHPVSHYSNQSLMHSKTPLHLKAIILVPINLVLGGIMRHDDEI